MTHRLAGAGLLLAAATSPRPASGSVALRASLLALGDVLPTRYPAVLRVLTALSGGALVLGLVRARAVAQTG